MRYLIISVLMWSYPMCAQCRSGQRDLLLVCQGRLVAGGSPGKSLKSCLTTRCVFYVNNKTNNYN